MLSTRFSRLALESYALPDGVADRVISPALVVYLDRVRENLSRVIAYAGGRPGRWRPHVKTVKLPEIFVELARAGVRHFKCATTREASYLLRALETQGLADADVLVAYPLVGPALRRLGQLARGHPNIRLSVLCEDPAAVEGVPQSISIFADVDPGMNRSGVPLDRVDAVLDIARRAGGRFRGVHAYEGQIHGANAGRRREQANACYARIAELVEHLRGAGLAVGELVTSGTPSFLYALGYEPFGYLAGTVHRVSPGTVVLHDLRSEQELEDLDLLPAAAVFSRVVSHPGEGIVTCDAGSKSIAAEAGDPCAFVLGHAELEPLRPSEEHLPLRVLDGTRPPRGTPLLLVPRHVCPTVNLAEEALLIEDGRLREVAPVRARAHDLLVDG